MKINKKHIDRVFPSKFVNKRHLTDFHLEGEFIKQRRKWWFQVLTVLNIPLMIAYQLAIMLVSFIETAIYDGSGRVEMQHQMSDEELKLLNLEIEREKNERI